MLLSPDGRFVAFKTPTGGAFAVYDRQLDQTILVSTSLPNTSILFAYAFSTDNHYLLLNNGIFDLVAGRTSVSLSISGSLAAISPNGRFISYVPLGPAGTGAVYRYDQQTTLTLRVNVASDGGSTNGNSGASAVDNSGTGTYFVRTRGQNACGVSGPSNETVVVVQ